MGVSHSSFITSPTLVWKLILSWASRSAILASVVDFIVSCLMPWCSLSFIIYICCSLDIEFQNTLGYLLHSILPMKGATLNFTGWLLVFTMWRDYIFLPFSVLLIPLRKWQMFVPLSTLLWPWSARLSIILCCYFGVKHTCHNLIPSFHHHSESSTVSFCFCGLPGQVVRARKSLMDIKGYSLTILGPLPLFYIFIYVHVNENLL